MKKHSFLVLGMFVALLAMVDIAAGIPIFSNNAVVTTVTNAATFDDINNNDPLLDYIEDGIIVSTDDKASEGFDAFNNGNTKNFYYGYWGNTTWVTISMWDGSIINSLDFLLGDGYSGFIKTNLIWETRTDDGSITGSGDLILETGTLVGWVDVLGFDSIRLAAHYNDINRFGENQAIALDDLRITTSTTIPEPATILLLATGLLGLLAAALSRKNQYTWNQV